MFQGWKLLLCKLSLRSRFFWNIREIRQKCDFQNFPCYNFMLQLYHLISCNRCALFGGPNSTPFIAFIWSQLEVCVPEYHFLGTGFFPKKSGKFPVPSIREHPLPGPESVPALGTGCFPVSFLVGKHLGIPERFPNEKYFIESLQSY